MTMPFPRPFARSTTVTALIGLADRDGTPIGPGASLVGSDGSVPRILSNYHLNYLLGAIGKEAGGFTFSETTGGWIGDSGELRMEPSAKIEIAITESPDRHLYESIREILTSVWLYLVSTDQESAMLHTPSGGWVTLRSDSLTSVDLTRQLTPLT